MRTLRKWLRKLTRRLSISASQRRHSLVGRPRTWKQKRDFQIRFLVEMGLEPHHYLVDLGCGTLRGGIPIVSFLDSGHYFGLEARPEVLDEGRNELNQSQLTYKKPTLIVSDHLASLGLGREFDFIWAFSVLIHMSDEILDDALRFASRHLKDNACMYANVNVSDQPDSTWQGFPIVRRSLEFYVAACSRNGLKAVDIGPLTDFGHFKPKQSIERQSTKRMLKICKSR